jgi:hypothetical protein
MATAGRRAGLARALRLRWQRWQLQARAWLLCCASGEPHYVADLIRRGEWAALDRLLAEMEEPDADR